MLATEKTCNKLYNYLHIESESERALLPSVLTHKYFVSVTSFKCTDRMTSDKTQITK